MNAYSLKYFNLNGGHMKRYLMCGAVVILILVLSACSGGNSGESANLLGMTMCNSVCGKNMNCDGAKGDLKENASTVVNYTLGNRYDPGKSGFYDYYPAGATQANITITLRVDNGKAKASFTAPDGTVTSVEASKDAPGTVSGVVALRTEKENPNKNKNNPAIESLHIDITVESVGGPATGVQVDFVVDDCFDTYCQKSAPICKK
jgi:hypothetical protein